MMNKQFVITVHDALTGETIVREMTDEEHAEYLEMIANSPAVLATSEPVIDETTAEEPVTTDGN